MKLPKRKQQELADKGRPDPPQPRGGSALGRLRQFEKERGLKETDLSNPATEELEEEKAKGRRASKK